MIGFDKVLSVVGEKRRISLGLAILAGYLLIWGTKSDDRSAANAADIVLLKQQYAAQMKVLIRVDKNIVRLNTRMGIRDAEHDSE